MVIRMSFSRDLMRGSLELMVLSVLAEAPLYVYILQKKLRDASGNMVRLQAGTLYPILHRLEEAGAITSRWEDTGGRDRKWYHLSAKGRRLLEEQATEWNDYANCIRSLLKPALRPA